jgi:hypothetical protein
MLAVLERGLRLLAMMGGGEVKVEVEVLCRGGEEPGLCPVEWL